MCVILVQTKDKELKEVGGVSIDSAGKRERGHFEKRH